ncbi:hypothetical protein [Streptomyces sp. NPDC087307]|uniref:hypothetical protein n=1 Tax=Streptomyces sp. NPDC087307 TaxID=3365782 RepID=UPI00382B22B4
MGETLIGEHLPDVSLGAPGDRAGAVDVLGIAALLDDPPSGRASKTSSETWRSSGVDHRARRGARSERSSAHPDS